MNVSDVIRRYENARDKKEREEARKEIEMFLSNGPVTAKDVVTVLLSVGVTTIIIYSLAQAVTIIINKLQRN